MIMSVVSAGGGNNSGSSKPSVAIDSFGSFASYSYIYFFLISKKLTENLIGQLVDESKYIVGLIR